MNLLYSFRYPKFQAFVENWFDTQYALTAPTNTDNCKRLFSRVVYPRIGNKKLNQINHKDIIEIITEYRKTAPKSVKTLVQLLRRIFIYAIDICDYNLINPVKTGTKLFYKGVKYGEFAVLDMPQIPVFFKQVDQLKVKKKQSITGFWLLAYTGLRRCEVMRADWNEINLETKTWVIPRHRMKARQGDHIVPLSSQVIGLLLLLQKQTGRTSGSLFDIDPSTPLYLCTAAGYKKRMTLHGLRKVFSTHAHESGLWTIDAIELQLAHRVGGIRGVYNKAQHLQERMRLMQWYADEVDKWRNI